MTWNKTTYGALVSACILAHLAVEEARGEDFFRRGDANVDSCIDQKDAEHILDRLFVKEPHFDCWDAADANDDGLVSVDDAVYILNFVELDGPPPESPFPECGPDPTPDDELGCEFYGSEVCETLCEDVVFRRGDSNDDLTINIADAIFTLNFLFVGGRPPPCPDSADTDDSGDLNLTDAVRPLLWLFVGGPPPPPPFPDCGVDVGPDELGDCVFTGCF